MANYTFQQTEPLIHFTFHYERNILPKWDSARIPYKHYERLKTMTQEEVQAYAVQVLGKEYGCPQIRYVDWWPSIMSDHTVSPLPPDGYDPDNILVSFCFVYWKAVTPKFFCKRITQEQLDKLLSLKYHDRRAYAAELCDFTNMLSYVKLLDWRVSGCPPRNQ